MTRARLEILSNTKCRAARLEEQYVALLDDALALEVPGARFSPRVRRGLWDGKRHLFNKNTGIFPRGLLARVEALLSEAEVRYRVCDLRTNRVIKPVDWSKLSKTMLKDPRSGHIVLRSYQMKAIRRALKAQGGILWLATNAGKTEVAAAIMMMLQHERALFLVHKKALLAQARERIAKRFGVIEEHIGTIGEGKFNPKHFTVATIQSLTRKMPDAKKRVIKKYLSTIRQLHVDEGHHTKATTWYRLVQSIDAPWRFLYSGTPFGSDNGLLVEATVGQVIARVSNEKLIKLGVSARPTIRMVKCDVPELSEQLTWDEVYKQGIVNNSIRNGLIAKHAARFAKHKKPVLILVKELWHGDNIMRELEARGVTCLFSHGQMPLTQVENNKIIFERGKVSVLVASTIYDEGVDVPAIRALIVADGGQSVRAVLQKIGRGLRKKKGRENVLDVIDFADLTHRYLAKHSQERLAIYEAEAFRVLT